jgi:filamin
VKLYGPAVETKVVRESIPAAFFINVAESGPGLIAVKLTSSEGKAVENYQVEDEGDGIYKVTFIPPKENTKITANIQFAGEEVPNSPFVMSVLPKADVDKVLVTGDIKKKDVPASFPAKFNINTKNAGIGDILVAIKDPQGKPVLPKMENVDEASNNYNVSFVPHEIGTYQCSIKYDGKEVPGSPFAINSLPVGDVRDIQQFNLLKN